MNELTISGFHIDTNTVFNFKSNPKRNGCKAYQRYEEYSKATNLDEYLNLTKDNKFGKADLRYDVEHFHLSLVKDGEVLNIQPKQVIKVKTETKEKEPSSEELDDIIKSELDIVDTDEDF